jgi:hypothetical protein
MSERCCVLDMKRQLVPAGPPPHSRTPAYTTYIDGPTWTDYFLLTELTKNPDGYRWAPLHAGT